MRETLNLIWNNIYLRVILLLSLTLAVLLMLGQMQFALQSFIAAFFIAYLLDPLVVMLKRIGIPRSVATVLVTAATIVVFCAAVLLLVNISGEIVSLPSKMYQKMQLARENDTLPRWLQPLGPILEEIAVEESLPADSTGAPLELEETVSGEGQSGQSAENPEGLNPLDGPIVTVQDLQALLQNGDMQGVLALATPLLTSVVRGVQNALTLLFYNLSSILFSALNLILSSVANGFIVLVFTIFMLASLPSIRQALYDIVPPRHHKLARELVRKMDVSVGGYVRAKLLEAFIMGMVAWIVLSLLEVPNAASLGVVNALLNPVPYLGPILSTIIESLIALEVSWQKALVVLILMFVIEQIDGNFLGPILLARTVKVHPVLILFSLLAGSALFGFWGFLFAIPVAAFLQLIYLDYYRSSRWYVADAPPGTLSEKGKQEQRRLEDKRTSRSRKRKS